MKKIFFFAIVPFTAIIFTGCKKGSTNNDILLDTFKVNIGSSENTFHVQAKATKLSVTTGFGIKIQGYNKDPGQSTTNLSFIIISPNEISAGIYAENPNTNPLVQMTHFVEGPFGTGVATSNYGSAANPLKITIIEVTPYSIKGTFEGELKGSSSGGGTPVKELLTNGVFHVSF